MTIQELKLWAQKLTASMSMREKAILITLVVVMAVSLAMSISGYVTRNSILVPQQGGIYTEAMVGQPRYLNPILASSSDIDLDLTRVIYSSLFKLDTNLKLQNDLADNVEVSSDGKIYTVHMRNDAVWHDDKPVTAEDVLFTVRSIQTPEYASPLASAFQGVLVDKVDDYTIRFTLQKTPYAPFLSSLTVGIAPKHVWENVPPRNAGLAEQELKPVGSGPFKFQELVTKKKTGETTSISLVRNDDYYGNKPYLAGLTFTFFTTHEEAIAALTSGQTNGIGYLPTSLLSSVNHRVSITRHTLLLPQYFGLFFNEAKNPILNNQGVRSALDLATDREEIIKQALSGEAEGVSLPIPPGLFSFEDIQGPSFDPEKAKQNLDDAGWKVGEDKIREKDGKKLEIAITTTDWPEYVQTAELLQKQWKEVGVSLTITSLGTGIIQQTVVGPRDYEILLYGENLSADPDPYPFWHSSQVKSPGLNLSLLKDKEIDKLLEDARTSTDTEKRRELLHKFTQRFLDIHPAIILYRPHYLFAQHQNVRGQAMHQGSLPSDRFNDIAAWHVRVKRVWNQ
ncbi:MAG: hypothetical protein A3C02_02700 [Candidatus Andersenbacteria bacterium RIFCSPHIGHO2_02_FULL_45_11]|uniref:Solute-binding protein family 5 domain-containing protein n=1 Tax=Candidatus Andersenbacteria bacterium RIFCSPHIGHO2_12_FULL_45_11 TaxID=1797281 RepID=A0A1G1WZU8_9BACT|nr:MAG: hypothetical protein A3C02_02700 [Candidatus Andersenbacteria bacterium RIFCSPHIGHO2_02_FULL_45_11]OGY33288.1 MAG: hypothetical protein A3D99_03090 [Candidatus Andersenbacteria bacterium RIFCSPHIGHO2_12_FULL_45_11]